MTETGPTCPFDGVPIALADGVGQCRRCRGSLYSRETFERSFPRTASTLALAARPAYRGTRHACPQCRSEMAWCRIAGLECWASVCERCSLIWHDSLVKRVLLREESRRTGAPPDAAAQMAALLQVTETASLERERASVAEHLHDAAEAVGDLLSWLED